MESNKRYTWKSYVFLTTSVLSAVFMLLLDLIGNATDVKFTGAWILLIILSLVVSVVIGIIAFSSKSEGKIIPIIASVLTVINVSIVVFFLWFGANFATSL